MTMHNTQSLYDELHRNLLAINKQIEQLERDVENQNKHFPTMVPATPHNQKSSTGQYLMTDLLVAKSQTLSAMAALKAAQMATTVPQQRRRP